MGRTSFDQINSSHLNFFQINGKLFCSSWASPKQTGPPLRVHLYCTARPLAALATPMPLPTPIPHHFPSPCVRAAPPASPPLGHAERTPTLLSHLWFEEKKLLSPYLPFSPILTSSSTPKSRNNVAHCSDAVLPVSSTCHRCPHWRI
jgi:hypothetical protein